MLIKITMQFEAPDDKSKEEELKEALPELVSDLKKDFEEDDMKYRSCELEITYETI